MTDQYTSNPFWHRKMKTLFALYHKNPDGNIGKVQIEESIQQIAAVTHSKQPETDKLRSNMDEVMTVMKMPEDGVNYDTFIQNVLTLISGNIVEHAVEQFFGVMDYDNNGVVSPCEYEKFLTCFNVDTSKAKEAFDYIDTNKNGQLSKAEFHRAIVKFHTCLDEDDPSKLIFGPLVE